jgi:hypothetical protein
MAPGTGYQFNGAAVYDPAQQNVSSGGGVDSGAMNKLMAFFGPPPKNPTMDATRDMWRTHDQFPAAYEGSSVFMGHVITGLIAEANDFLSTIICPKVLTDEIHFNWTLTKFNQTLVPEVPHEGVGRVLEYTEESGEAHSVRRGQSIKLEFDFFRTQKGKETYYNQVTQLTNNVIRTYQLDILHAIRNCHATEQAWRNQYGVERINVQQRLRAEVDQFAIIPKDVDAKGIFKLVSLFKRHAERLGFEIDAVLGRDIMMRWVELNQIKSTAYIWRGPGGIEQMQRAGAGVGTLVGLPFYPIKNYADIYGNEQIGPMQSFAQIGEFNWVPAPGAATSVYGQEPYIEIYCEEDDSDDAKITWKEAHKAIHWDALDKLYDEDTDFAAKWDKAYNKKRPSAIEKEKDYIVLLERPFMKYRMESLVFMKAGESTGVLNMGVGDFSFSQDGKIKTLYCFYTYYSACVIHNEKQVLIADNVHYDQYLGGCSEKFITVQDLDELKQQQYRFENLDPNSQIFTKSIIAWPVPKDVTTIKAGPHDITGFFVDDALEKNAPIAGLECLGHYLMTQGQMDRAPRGLTFQRRIPAVNTIVFQGFQKMYKNSDPKPVKVIRNTGHHGPQIYPGCGKIRQGQDYEYKQITYIESINA